MSARYVVAVAALVVAGVAPLAAQGTPAPSPRVELTADQQIAVAVLPLPASFRDSATVMGYGADGKMKVLRPGQGAMVCLASDPASERFHVACYHRALDPFMARGRALRAQGIKGDQIDSFRFAEVRSGQLKFPTQAASLYSLTGPAGTYHPATGAVTGARHLYVVYLPNATAASTGLPDRPTQGVPWIMHPGTIKAHIMFVPSM